MRLSPLVRDLILGDPQIAAIIGDRCYPAFIPEWDATPAVVYRRQATSRENHLTGSGGLADVSIELRATSASYDQVEELEELIRLRCDSYRGEHGAINIRRIQIADGADEVELAPDNSDSRRHSRVIDLRIQHTETQTRLPGTAE